MSIDDRRGRRDHREAPLVVVGERSQKLGDGLGRIGHDDGACTVQVFRDEALIGRQDKGDCGQPKAAAFPGRGPGSADSEVGLGDQLSHLSAVDVHMDGPVARRSGFDRTKALRLGADHDIDFDGLVPPS